MICGLITVPSATNQARSLMGTLRKILTEGERDMSSSSSNESDDTPPRNFIDPVLPNEQDRRQEEDVQLNAGASMRSSYPTLPSENVYPGPYPPRINGYFPKYNGDAPVPPPPPIYLDYHDHRKPAPYPSPSAESRYGHHLPRPSAWSQDPAQYERYAQVTYTEDSSTKLSDRVRRRCFNCYTTDTSTWRRSTLSPGKVLCNKCGLFERSHRRQRPEQIAQEKGKRPGHGAREGGQSLNNPGGSKNVEPALHVRAMSSQHLHAPVPMRSYSLPAHFHPPPRPPPPHSPGPGHPRYILGAYIEGPTLHPALANQRDDSTPPPAPPTTTSTGRGGSPPGNSPSHDAFHSDNFKDRLPSRNAARVVQ